MLAGAEVVHAGVLAVVDEEGGQVGRGLVELDPQAGVGGAGEASGAGSGLETNAVRYGWAVVGSETIAPSE